MLQCVAVRCSALQSVDIFTHTFRVLQCTSLIYGLYGMVFGVCVVDVLQCVAV